MLKKAIIAFFLLAFSAAPAPCGPEAGGTAPDFSLFGADYRYHELSEYLARPAVRAAVIIFTSNHCPISLEYDEELIKLANKSQRDGFAFIAINPHPAGADPASEFRLILKRAEEKNFPYPYVYDGNKGAAGSYGVRVTPEVFIVGRGRRVLYRGAVDNLGGEPFYLIEALEDILAGRPVRTPRSMPLGCIIDP